MRSILSAMASLALALPSAAQTIGGEAAEKMLFETGGAEMVANPRAGLSEDEVGLLRKMVEANDFRYYGAIAYSPDEGLISETIQGAFDFHDVRAASAAALRQCEQVRRPGTRPCIVAVQLLPQRFKDVPFTLSQSATEAFGPFRRTAGAKAMAISPATGAFGVATGEAAPAAAVAACNQRAAKNDCRVVVDD